MTTALLDTCVLVPSRARDLLLGIASAGVYRPLWSTEILTELDRTLRFLLAKRGTPPEEADAYLTRLFRQMRITFPDALVTGWEPLVPTIHLPDPDDRHVVAAARTGRADVIVTDNSPISHPQPCRLRSPGSHSTTSCLTPSTSTPAKSSPPPAPSPAVPGNQVR